MKIAIIGGGWVGCHLAYKLKELHSITLYEKNTELFLETSYNNQNRLHSGFHYARNFKTREMCRETYSQFMEDYGFLTNDVKNNLYCVPNTKSIIDYGTYIQIFKDFEKEKSDLTFKDVQKDMEQFFIDVKRQKIVSDYYWNKIGVATDVVMPPFFL